MDRLVQWIDNDTIDTIIVAGIDLQGRLYGKRLTAEIFLRDMHEGVHTCDCNFGWDIQRQLIDGLDFTGWPNGYGDMTSVPDFTTLRMIPWHEKTALVLCDTVDHHGQEIPIAPRTLLATQIQKAADMGFEAKLASELEFFLFQETLDSSREKNYTDLQVASQYISDYSIFRSSMDEWILGDMRRQLGAAGIEIEGNKSEWGHGQVEFNLVYTNAMRAADNHALFKLGAREIAALNGIQITFMAKWHQDHSGNGCHVHTSLWKDGKNAFPGNGNYGESDTMRHFLGGMMHAAADLQVLAMPTVNSYKRMESLSFAPDTLTWGGDNRTTAFRIAGHGNSSRLENRIAGTDVNQHLLYAIILASGLHGIENKTEPIGPFIEGNAYELKDAPKLHTNLTDATNAFYKSDLARELLTDPVVDHYTRIYQWEQQEFQRHVTDYERNRYFELT